MKKAILLILLCGSQAVLVTARESGSIYAGVNPVAAVSFAPNSVNMYLSLLNGFETGLSLNLEYFLSDSCAVHLKLACGPADRMTWNWQFHAGTLLFVLPGSGIADGLYAGAFLKVVDLFGTAPRSDHYFSLIPYAALGYRFEPSDFFLDIRLNQTLYAVSWSSARHTGVGTGLYLSPWSAILPVLPVFSFTAGYRLQ